MTPLFPLLLGLASLAAGAVLLRRLGPKARIGRILASTPVIPVDRARELALAGTERYVAVGGRIDAEEDFPDENERPLVYRRTRLELRGPRGWTIVDDRREALPFEVAGGLARLAVDHEALDEGLVTVERQSIGTAGEIPDRVPAGTDPQTPARLRVQFLSTVDHGLVLGVPAMDPLLGPTMRAGMGRPLVLTTLEPEEAMRLLAVDHQGTTRAATVLLATGVVLAVAGLAWTVIDALV